MNDQDQFDLMIGRLDHILSQMMGYARGALSEPNRQTLKHHAEDMELAAKAIFKKLGIEPKPIDVMLHCPVCHQRHVDRPESSTDWKNPPHKSHLCLNCGCIWRPADVPTNGTGKIQTRGEKDTWP